TINQHLADVNSFHFTWRQPEGEVSLSAQVSFYNNNLCKEVNITIGANFTFKGIIYAISCNNQDSIGVSYEISGKGLFEKLNQVPECRSFYKKNITDIFNAVNNTSGTTLDLSPSNNSELFYTVQYNQTAFSFLRMMAVRYGEWLYYNGTEMVLKTPSDDAVTLNQGQDVTNLDISAKLVRSPINITAFNRHSGEELTHQVQNNNADGYIGAAQHAGETAYGSSQSNTNITAAATQQLLTDMSVLSQKAAASNAVVVRAQSNNCNIKLAGKIKLIDEAGNSNGEYIITEIHHSVSTDDNYRNQFVALPAEAEVPPYTNPFSVPICQSQMAKVINNEDADGLDRIKVHFPWQQSGESTPWLNVITPHGGKDRGFRFLPEINDEVLVAFLDNHAERPYVLGGMFTENNKSGNAHEGNHVKVIGTKTGRRIEINEDEATMGFMDNYKNKKDKNIIEFKKKDDPEMKIQSLKGDNDGSMIAFKNSESLKIELKDGGSLIAEIIFEKNGKKLTIHSADTIEIKADQALKLNAQKIEINGTQELKMEGMTVDIDGKTKLQAKGLTATFEGSTTAEFKGGAMASLTGAIVKIN
ncbi:MAG TPA: phage baseplate assembly protein V, partial [Ferruginibacter sp.]|nr:phage baseplate assembly protein V [Ferruginibacter sp.]